MYKSLSIVLVVAIMLVTLAGCGGGGGASTADAQKKVCDTLASVKTSAGEFATLDANAKVADLKQMKTKIDGPIQAVKTANQMLKLTQVDALVAAYDGLSKTVDGLSGDTLGDAAAQIQTGAKAVDGALSQATTALKCSQ